MVNTSKPINVIYVPWYLKANMDALGIDLDILDNDILNSKVTEKLSEADIVDLKILNVFLHKYLFVTTNGINPTLSNMIISTNNMNDNNRKEKELELVNLLSSDDCNKKDTYSMMYKNNTAYVVLDEGSTNFIKFSNKNDKYQFLRSLVNFMFKHFSTTDVYVSPYFKSFITLKNK